MSSITLKNPRELTASDWQLYTSTMDCTAAAVSLNAALARALEAGSPNEFRSLMLAAMKPWRHSGAMDSEPIYLMEAYCCARFPSKDDGVEYELDWTPRALRGASVPEVLPARAPFVHQLGCVLGDGLPDWPADLATFEERRAYQRGVADERHRSSLALVEAASPDFSRVRDKRMSELSPAQRDDAMELWLRQNLGAMPQYHREHYTFLLGRLDAARAHMAASTKALAAPSVAAAATSVPLDISSAANQALEDFNFGSDATCEGRGSWSHELNDGLDDWTCVVYLRFADQAPGTDSERASFHAKFRPGTTALVESYAYDMRTGAEIVPTPEKAVVEQPARPRLR